MYVLSHNGFKKEAFFPYFWFIIFIFNEPITRIFFLDKNVS